MSRPVHIDPDEDALSLMAQGDASGLELLMTRHLATIKSLAWHMLGDDGTAEDIAQDVFLKTWLKAASWEPGQAKIITWMRRVTTNMCLDRLRKHKEKLPGELPDMISEDAGADQTLVEAEQSARVQAALQELPERQRAAITLCHYQYCSQSEAADILGVSVRAYESLLARARRSLKAMLSETDSFKPEIISGKIS